MAQRSALACKWALSFIQFAKQQKYTHWPSLQSLFAQGSSGACELWGTGWRYGHGRGSPAPRPHQA